jgi:phenylalanine-4-hydroxylase
MHSDTSRKLHLLYQTARKIRNGEKSDLNLQQVWNEVRRQYPEDWLLPLEILELVHADPENNDLKEEISHYLKEVKSQDPDVKRLIDNGLLLIQ